VAVFEEEEAEQAWTLLQELGDQPTLA